MEWGGGGEGGAEGREEEVGWVGGGEQSDPNPTMSYPLIFVVLVWVIYGSLRIPGWLAVCSFVCLSQCSVIYPSETTATCPPGNGVRGVGGWRRGEGGLKQS